MSTVDKALNLLNYFTLTNPEWGLSDLARAAALDKATILRLLRSMERHDLIEQDAQSKKFRLGKAFLTLARVREQSFPLATIVVKWLERIAAETGETAHVSLGTERAMTTIGISEPQRSARVSVDPSEPLPFHATASGMVFLAFGPPRLRESILSAGNLERFTPMTETSVEGFRNLLVDVRKRGFAVSDQAFEAETFGIAVPFFDSSAAALGAIAVATPIMRMTRELKHRIEACLMKTSLEIAASLGSSLPQEFEAVARKYQ
ncbi:MAG: IclR family transcriptional regulator [Rhizobiaceae bacterium]